jgi:hypothetical protein
MSGFAAFGGLAAYRPDMSEHLRRVSRRLVAAIERTVDRGVGGDVDEWICVYVSHLQAMGVEREAIVPLMHGLIERAATRSAGGRRSTSEDTRAKATLTAYLLGRCGLSPGDAASHREPGEHPPH